GRIAAADPGPHARVREGVGPVVGVIPGHVELGEVGCPVVLERRFQAEPGFQARTQRKAHAGPRPLCRLQGRLETLTEHIFRQALLRDGGAEGKVGIACEDRPAYFRHSLFRRGVALMNKVFGAAEVHVRIVLHVGDDDDVGVLNVQIDVAFNEEVQGQLQIGQEVVVIDVFEFLLDVDRDDHVGAAVAGNVGGDGVFHPAVDVVAAVDGNGREYAGYGHAGDERLGQTARLHHEFVARYDVRHHGVEGALQVFDLRAARQVVEELLERVGIEHGTPGRNVQGEQGRE